MAASCADCGRETKGRGERCRSCALSASWERRNDDCSRLRIPDDPAVRAYLAGLLDGEGCITIRPAPKRSVQVQIANTDESLMRWLEGFGGFVYSQRYENRRGAACKHSWQINSRRDVSAFLTALLPYMRIKTEKARRAIAVFAHIEEENHVA